MIETMSIPFAYSLARYLAAKQSVDDRALNWQVWQRLVAALPRATAEQPLRILEVGAGIGSMVERLLASDVLTHATYTAIDKAPTLMDEARRRLSQWAAQQGFQVDESRRRQLHMRRAGNHITVETEAIDVARFIAREHGRRTWDLLIGQAFLDLVDMPTIMPGLCSLVRPNGLLYFPTTFDGDTVFQPEGDAELDRTIKDRYHQIIDQRVLDGKPSGDSRAGRRLFAYLRTAGMDVLAAGSSDWVIFAGIDGYPADEAYFLHDIIHTIDSALTGHPQLDAERLGAWVAQRHAQIEQGTLVYMAHQLDVLGRVTAPIGARQDGKT
jgi:2-polyprenyl-3-methyl-5-hydroxy-6-metoxy-1,4-benzoquinol methylase